MWPADSLRRFVRILPALGSVLGKHAAQRGFTIAPLQADWVKEKLRLNEIDLMQDLRLLLASGEQIQGADTYRYAMKRIWWAYPIYLFSIVPVGRKIFDWSYRNFASHRYQISRACKLS